MAASLVAALDVVVASWVVAEDWQDGVTAVEVRELGLKARAAGPTEEVEAPMVMVGKREAARWLLAAHWAMARKVVVAAAVGSEAAA